MREHKVLIMRMKKGPSPDSRDTEWIIKVYYEKLDSNEFDNLNEMEKFSERHKLLKLT